MTFSGIIGHTYIFLLSDSADIVCPTVQSASAGYKGLDKCMPNQGQLTYWRVRAIDDPLGVEGIFSDANAAMPDKQAYKVVYSSGVVNRLSPANGDLNVAVPTFRWSPSQDAQRYEVDVYDKNPYIGGSENSPLRTRASSANAARVPRSGGPSSGLEGLFFAL